MRARITVMSSSQRPARDVIRASQAAASGSRVVYVDNDEVAVAHSRLMLEDNPDATVIQADLREPAKILADPETQLLIDFTQPVALLLLAVLHFVPDEADPAQIMATLRDAVPPGSYLVICHACRDVRPDRRTTRPPYTPAGSRRSSGYGPATRSRPCSTASPWWSRGWCGYPRGGQTHPPMCRRTRSNSGPSSAWPGATANKWSVGGVSRRAPRG
jgi:S-adenosyl methyltransferase